MTTTSPTSSMATSRLTRKPERSGNSAAPQQDKLAGSACFFSGRPLWTPRVCGYTAALGKVRRAPAQSGSDVFKNGAIAQLGERFNGIEEVVGSIPSGSTITINHLVGLQVQTNAVSEIGKHQVSIRRQVGQLTGAPHFVCASLTRPSNREQRRRWNQRAFDAVSAKFRQVVGQANSEPSRRAPAHRHWMTV